MKQNFDQILLAAARAAAGQGHTVLGLNIGPRGSQALPGVLCAANAESFNATFMSQPLTTYIQGMPDQDNVQGELDYICPAVPCGRLFQFRKFGNTQMFLSELDDARGIGANFKAVEYQGDLQTERTINKGLAFIGDLDVLSEIPNWEQLYANWLRVRVLRNELRRAYIALLALDAGTGADWGSDAAADPDVDCLDLVNTMGDTTGLDPNAIVFGRSAWSLRVRNLRAKPVSGALAGAMWSPKELGDWLGVEDVRMSRTRFTTGDGTKTRMLASYVIAFLRSSSPIMEDPSSLKRFVTTGGAGAMQVYRRELSAKLVEISVGHYSNIVAVGSAARLNIN